MLAALMPNDKSNLTIRLELRKRYNKSLGRTKWF
jgi:hypothetical protein